MKIIRDTIRGCGGLEHCGSHPGNGPLFFLVLVGALAGLGEGAMVSAIGAGLMALTFGPAYLIGARDRARYNDHLSRTSQESSETSQPRR